MSVRYATLTETNGKELESWYYFIKYEGNEEALKHLDEQLNQIDAYILDEMSTFDLDIDHLVSEQTAKEMSKVEVNSYMYHRKYDGVLKKINLFDRKDDNEMRLFQIHEKLSYGQIDEYVDGEDIDPQYILSGSETDNLESSDDSYSSSNKD